MDRTKPLERMNRAMDRRSVMTRALGYSALAVSAPMALAGSAVAQTSARPEPKGHMSGWEYLPGRQRAPFAWFIDGNKRSMNTDQFMGKPVLMVFWQQDCHYCLRDMPRLNAAYNTLTSKGVAVLPMTIGPAKLTAQIREHYQQRGYDKLPIYADAAAEMQVGYAVRGTPTWYLIDKSGFVVGYIERPVDWNKPDAQSFLSHFV